MGALTNPQTQNGYDYANGNPVNKSDPSGKFVPQVLVLGGAYVLLGLEIGGAINGFRNCGGMQGALIGAQNGVQSPLGQAALGVVTLGAMLYSPSVGSTEYHGNDLRYPGPTTGYQLFDEASGVLMKNGISNTPDTRYTQSQMDGLIMNKVIVGTRADVYEWEYQQNLEYFNTYGQLPPLNNNFH